MLLSLSFLLSYIASHAYGSYVPSGGSSRFQEEESSSCQKYIILTTPRSGSTWVCNLFDLQDEVVCGGLDFGLKSAQIRKPELMVKYSLMTIEEQHKVSWSQYEKDLTAAFQDATVANESCNSSSSGAAVRAAAGFKLMYNQIPPKFIHSGQIIDYLVQNNIAVIQLVREAKILRLSSLKRIQWLEDGEAHSFNEAVVQNFRKRVTPIPWDDSVIHKIHYDERKDRKWGTLLKQAKLRYHRLVYEKMLSKEGLQTELEAVFDHFNFTHSPDRPLNFNSQLLQLQRPTCKDRVEGYAEFREKIYGTRTLSACDILDNLYNNDHQDESSV